MPRFSQSLVSRRGLFNELASLATICQPFSILQIVNMHREGFCWYDVLFINDVAFLSSALFLLLLAGPVTFVPKRGRVEEIWPAVAGR